MTEQTKIIFPAPGPLLNMNDRLHWRAQRNRESDWQEAVQWAVVMRFKSPSRRKHPPCLVEITLPVQGGRKRDPHNYFPTVKQIIDGLVKAKVWPDDDPRWVTTREPVLDPEATLVTVTLTPRELLCTA